MSLRYGFIKITPLAALIVTASPALAVDHAWVNSSGYSGTFSPRRPCLWQQRRSLRCVAAG